MKPLHPPPCVGTMCVRGTDFMPDGGWDYNPGKEGLNAWKPDLEKYPEELIGSSIQAGIESEAFDRFISGDMPIDFPVAVLDEAFRSLIGAHEKAVLFSAESLAKNRAGHPELSIHDSRLVRRVIETAQTVIQDGDRTLVFLKRNGAVCQAVVNSLKSGRGLFPTSYRRSGLQDIQRAKKKGRIVKDDM